MAAHPHDHHHGPLLYINQMLDCYDISPINGFACGGTSITTFADPSFKPWLQTASNLPNLISSKKLRSTIDSWPHLSPEQLVSLEEYRLAYLLLGHLVHAYIWANLAEESPCPRIPAPLARPFLEIVNELEVPLGICFASTALWNYTLDSEGKEGCVVGFTGTSDEVHFNLTSRRVEVAGAEALTAALKAARVAARTDKETVAEVQKLLKQVAQSLGQCKVELLKMKDGLDPAIFYHRLRPYLVSSQALPDGVVFVTDTDADDRYQLGGSTGGQSSLFQALDILLGVQHSDASGRAQFVQSMRRGMPSGHARFLEDIRVLPSIRTFVQNQVKAENGAEELVATFNAALDVLKTYRDSHVQVVTLFVVTPAGKTAAADGNNANNPGSTANFDESGSTEPRGTGGSELFSLLKGMREDMKEARLG
ncbi:IDO-domain-containing protein [Mycena venus]|uniref:IDO-domain-containing protein n=1 Tax=Mycena venus TaxID=2733690 RepID=A0A8H7C9J9_9AGAR|nr:IDO-domain-containing protein [Mycena venus]